MADFNVVLHLNDTDETTINIDKGLVEELSSLTQSSPNPDEINYSLVPNTGMIRIVDRDASIKSIIEEKGIDASKISIDVFLNGKKIQTHIASGDISYSVDDSILAIPTTNITSLIQQKKYEPLFKGNKTAYTILKQMLNSLGYTNVYIDGKLNKYIYVTRNNEKQLMSDYLKKIKLPDTFLSGGYLSDGIQHLCELAQLNIVFDEDGDINIYSSRPIITNDAINDTAIHIPQRCLYSTLNYSPISKNPINGVDYINYLVSYDDTYNGYYIDSDVIDLTNKGANEPLSVYLTRNYANFEFYVNETFIFGKFVSSPNLSSISNLLEVVEGAEPFCKAKWTDTSNVSHEQGSELDEDESFSDFITSVTTYHSSDQFAASRNSGQSVGLYQNMEYYFAIKIANLKSFEFLYGSSLEIYTYSTSNSKTLGGNNRYDLTKNTFITQNSKIDYSPVINVAYETMNGDYNDGLKSATVKICYSDLYYKNGTIAINTQNGDMLDIGDIVYFDNDTNAYGNQRYWKITGRKFTYDAAPYIDLELQELKNEDSIIEAGLYDDNGNLLYTWEQLVQNGYITVTDGAITSARTLNGHLIISPYVYYINNSAFIYNSGLKSVTIPYGIYAIYGNAFKGCSNLETVINKSRPNEIYSGIFDDCYKLSLVVNHINNVNYPANEIRLLKEIDTTEYEGSARELNYIKTEYDRNYNSYKPKYDVLLIFRYYSESNRTVLMNQLINNYPENIVIPEKVTVGGVEYYVLGVNSDALDNGQNIKSLTIPSGVTSISASFEYCTSLEELIVLSDVVPTLSYTDIPNSVKCIYVKDSLYQSYLSDSSWSTYSSKIAPYSWKGKGLFNYETGEEVYSWKEALNNNYITATNTSVTGCSLPSSVSQYKIKIPSTITSIGDSAFSSAYGKLYAVDMPNVTTIGNSAFRSCYMIKELNMPLVETIGDEAFYNLAWLENVYLPSCLSFGSSIFAACYRLKNIKFDSVTTFGNTLFGYESDIPSWAYLIETIDMRNCQSIPTFTGGDMGWLGAAASTYQIVVPDSLYSQWISTERWTYVASHIIKASDFQQNN